ncbi:MAG: phosphate uptake regulator PhoU [Nitrososphaerota archaeon]|nr:phosphate uptake regulator PhoU [Candidatus Bathyarchaeota archaeon]MDW8048911.1 phosphate uptake regulator PhoU [Nitrososphaerota archaeon]
MEKDLGYRKVQSTGRKSYIISLPKKWVESLGLDKGSEIAFKVQEDSSLVLTPRKILESKRERRERKEYWVHVNPDDNVGSLRRRITSLYVVSANTIHVTFKDASTALKFRNEIHEIVKNFLLGAEIVEETPRRITIQILIDQLEFPVEKAIRRMAVLALSASNDVISNLKDISEETARGILMICNDVYRLSLYVTRQLKYGLERNAFKELGFKTAKEFLGYRLVVNDVKAISDNALNIINNLMAIKPLIESGTIFSKEPIDEEVYSQILDYNNHIHRLFEESLKALFKRNYIEAERVIREIDLARRIENQLSVLISSKKMDPAFSSLFSLILDNVRRMADYGRNIAEVALNRTVEEISIQEPTN